MILIQFDWICCVSFFLHDLNVSTVLKHRVHFRIESEKKKHILMWRRLMVIWQTDSRAYFWYFDELKWSMHSTYSACTIHRNRWLGKLYSSRVLLIYFRTYIKMHNKYLIKSHFIVIPFVTIRYFFARFFPFVLSLCLSPVDAWDFQYSKIRWKLAERILKRRRIVQTNSKSCSNGARWRPREKQREKKKKQKWNGME